MKITYTGRKVDLAPAQWKRIEEQAAKLGKLLDGKDEREAHVIVGFERGRHTVVTRPIVTAVRRGSPRLRLGLLGCGGRGYRRVSRPVVAASARRMNLETLCLSIAAIR